MKHGKRYRMVEKLIDSTKKYSPEETIELVIKTANCKFDESVDVAIKLGIDPKKADQQVRGVTTLPHGTGKKTRILVFAQGEKQQEAQEAGADIIGGAELVEKIKEGFLDFDICLSTPDMMKEVTKIGKILGPRKLMPSPKSGTVTFDLKGTIKELRKGRLEFRIDKLGVIHTIIGKVSFGRDKLLENFKTLIQAVVRAKPPTSKGQYIKSITLSSTMGPGIKVDVAKTLSSIGK